MIKLPCNFVKQGSELQNKILSYLLLESNDCAAGLLVGAVTLMG